MTTTSVPLGRPSTHGFLRELAEPRQVFAHLGPNWFASIMGTGIVANAAATLPLGFPGLRTAATVVWALAALMLLVLLGAWAVHWFRHPANARGHAGNPVMAQFWGAPPMALMTVGAGTLLLGGAWIGTGPALTVDWVLWTAGTLLGLVTAVWIPFRMMTSHDIANDSAYPQPSHPDAYPQPSRPGAFGGWLMPVVPPMVSAATGALLIPHVPGASARLVLLLFCYAMFGMSLFATLFLLPQIWQRLVEHKGPATLVPTVWIVLGPLGQSITAASALAGDAPAPAAIAAVLYGVPVWGFAMLWLALAAALTVRAARDRLPFALTWWSFTFPLGTVVTGTSALAARVHSGLFTAAATALYVLLVLAWITVAAHTVRGSYTGALFRRT